MTARITNAGVRRTHGQSDMTGRQSAQWDQILAALSAAPLDRVRLMKTLFLFWYRRGKPRSGPFRFRPYLYGPCAFDLYGALEDMEREGLVVQAPHPVQRWGRYYLTELGTKALALAGLTREDTEGIGEIANWAAMQGFRSLLEQVYREAPDYASESVLS